MIEKKQPLKSMDSERKTTILMYLGISEKEWDKACSQCPELATLKPEMIIRHFKENTEGLGMEHKEWLRFCRKTPQLYEMNLATLRKHIEENAKLMGISEDEWIKVCTSEPGLFIYNRKTLEKSLKSCATVLGISEDRWRRICKIRGALLTYRPETLVNKIDKFMEYVRSPRSFLKKQFKPSDIMRQTLTDFEGRSLERSKVLDGFLRHPNNFLSTPEKMAYSFAYITMMAKAFGVRENEYRFLSYIDLPVESNLKMHYLFACSNYQNGKKVSLFTLVGETKRDVRKRLLGSVQSQEDMRKTDEEVISAYPCPFLQRLKNDKENL